MVGLGTSCLWVVWSRGLKLTRWLLVLLVTARGVRGSNTMKARRYHSARVVALELSSLLVCFLLCVGSTATLAPRLLLCRFLLAFLVCV